jgi:1,4-alpha-glucan branching enzyme
MSISKKYLKSKAVCRVKFSIPCDKVGTAKIVQLLGDFNNWSYFEAPMKRTKNGNYCCTRELPARKEYQFRYFINGRLWMNDANADKLIHDSSNDLMNSLIVV